MKVSGGIRNLHSKKLALIISAVSLAALALQRNNLYAQEGRHGIGPIAVLSPSDVPPGYTNSFGWSVAISGNYIVVGAPRDPVFNGDATGAAYVFRRLGPTWIEQAKLTASDGVWQDQLGWSVAIDGDVVVAGAPRWEFEGCLGPQTGAVYVFRRDDHGTPNDPIDDTWPQEAKLTVADPRIAERLGMSVAVSGNVIVAGGECGEAAVVFRWDGTEWRPDGTLRGSDTQGTDSFALSVSVAGNVVGVTSPGDAYPCPGFEQCQGSAYVFRYTQGSWIEEAKLIGSGVRGIGSSISAFHRRFVVGRPGGAHVFRFGVQGWVEEQVLVPDDPFAGDFGRTVALSGEMALVSNTGDPWAFLFRREKNEWIQQGGLVGLTALVPGPVALNGKYALVSTYVYAVAEHHSLRDYADFQNCFHQSIRFNTSECCGPLDVISDGMVDLGDFEDFMGTFAGP